MSSVCHNLHCRTPNASSDEGVEIFFAGPALTGTKCGKDKWCDGGDCVESTSLEDSSELYDEVDFEPPKCESACLADSKGIEVKRKIEGRTNYFEDKKLCNDEQICSSRRSVIFYGTAKCQEFSRSVDVIDPNGYGLQGAFNGKDFSMSCSIYCKRTNSSFYFSPRVQLNAIGLNPYYPDGTLCHRDGSSKYYCINAHCLPH